MNAQNLRQRSALRDRAMRGAKRPQAVRRYERRRNPGPPQMALSLLAAWRRILRFYSQRLDP